MENNSFKTWPESATRLVDVAAGRSAADTVLTGGRIVNVHTREILDGWQVAMADGRFAYVGPDASHCIDEGTEVIDVNGDYLIPGLCDAHMHIESGMMTPAEFAAAVIPHGTTSMFTDPHEIANVMGLEGVKLMHDEALIQPNSIFTQMPSCAPSAPGLETTGFEISVEDVEEAMAWPGIIGLGEMMSFPAVVNSNPKMLAEIAATQRAGKTVGGHYASADLGPAFHAYAAAGPADDHEGTCEADAIARVRQGMRSMMRLGSAWYDVETQITAITEKGLDPRNFILCTDDCMAATLVNDGHMNRVVRHAIDCGCDPIIALQMATINTAAHFGLERELGSIAPGRRADVVVTSNLKSLPIGKVFAKGQMVAEDGSLLVKCPHIEWPKHARNTVHLGKKLNAEDFAIKGPEGVDTVRAKVIGVIENQAPTQALDRDIAVKQGLLVAENPVCQIALVERHRATGDVVNCLVEGFNYHGIMALASTVAHDSHHMIVVGTDAAQMALAANRLGEVGGGVSLWKDGKEVALVELPIAGLMSDAPANKVAAKAEALSQAMRDCGCTMNNAFMQHSLLALVVIPDLRISDLGLVDVNQQKVIPMMEAAQ